MTELVLTPLTLPDPGILGIEGRHQWNDGVVLGDLTTDPHAHLSTIPGLFSIADPEDLRDVATGRPGEIPRRSDRRGKTITYNGEVRAHSLHAMRSLWTQIAGSFVPMSEGRMVVRPHPSYTEGVTRYFRARCLTADPGDEEFDLNNYWPYQLPFAIGLRLSDARFYDPVSVEGDTSPAGAGSLTLTNPGTAPADPLITVHGPLPAAINLTNTTLGKVLVFTGLSVASGHYLQIDFASRRILLDGVTEYGARLNLVASDWWDAGVDGLKANAANTITISGSGLASPAYAHVAFFPPFLA